MIALRLAQGLLHQLRPTDEAAHQRPQLNVPTQDARWFLLCKADGVTVTTADRWKLGQLAPGSTVRFVAVRAAEAPSAAGLASSTFGAGGSRSRRSGITAKSECTSDGKDDKDARNHDDLLPRGLQSTSKRTPWPSKTSNGIDGRVNAAFFGRSRCGLDELGGANGRRHRLQNSFYETTEQDKLARPIHSCVLTATVDNPHLKLSSKTTESSQLSETSKIINSN